MQRFILIGLCIGIIIGSLLTVALWHLDARAASRSAQVIADEEAGVIRFMIDGKTVARIDAEGLQVRESIEFGGVITDVGTAKFDARVQGGSANAP